jgi:hypothetical protein
MVISVWMIRIKEQAASRWANQLVLPPRWLAPAFGLIPSIQDNPRAIPRGSVLIYWFSVAWILFNLLSSSMVQPGPSIAWYSVGLFASSAVVGFAMAWLSGRYWSLRT